MNRPIAVFGAHGQLGREIVALARQSGVAVAGLARGDADIADALAVRRALAELRPRLVVNAAAYTDVDRAQTELEAAEAGNVTGPGVLAQEAAALGLPMVHFSTDFVFDGTRSGPYAETDAIVPTGVYGRSKAAGEARVRAASGRHIILRTSWVYGQFGANFLKTILHLAQERDELRVVADQRGGPTATLDLAEAVLAVDRTISANPEGEHWGTFHFAASGIASRHSFASEIVAAAHPFTGRRPKVVAIASGDYPVLVRRPANSALDSTRFIRKFGYAPAPWQQRVGEVVRQIYRPGGQE